MKLERRQCKPRVMFIFTGPKYDLEQEFRHRFEKLSQSFQGVVYTASPFERQERFGEFDVVAAKIPERPGLLGTVKFIVLGIFLALKKRRTAPFDLVVSYDPLLTGFVGLIIARLTHAKFCTEVNGDYGDPDNYADVGSGIIARLKQRLYVPAACFVLKRADGVRLLHAGQTSYCVLKKSTKVVHLFDFVDLRAFSNNGENKRVLFAGFPFYRKGVDILIEAFKKVADEFPDWTLEILGWYPDKQLLETQIGGHPRIYHHAPVPHREMPNRVGSCAFVVLPSRSEAMGRILIEAAAAGKARIGSMVGGIPTVICGEVDGLLFRKGSVEELAEKMRRLMSDEGLRRRLGEMAARRSRTEFSETEYFNRISNFYISVIDGGSEVGEHSLVT